MKIKLAFITTLVVSSTVFADEKLVHVGSFDNVRASETNHCYGKTVSLWEIQGTKMIGLFNVYAGPCFDPACSIVEGQIAENKINFQTKNPIHDKYYIFDGEIIVNDLIGLLNNNEVSLSLSDYQKSSTDLDTWCSNWSGVNRCKGVQNYCN